jgi:GT2 family glycosyltransferase
MNDLSVIIPSRTLSNLTPCAQAVARHEESVDTIVVWDRSNGNEWLPPTHYYRVREVEMPFVYARNCNIGIESAGDNDVILLNDDALLQTHGGFTAMQRVAAEHPEYGVIAAVTNIVGNKNQMPQGSGLREDPRMICFVCVFIPRGTIDRVGLLDEEFVGYGFDDDSYCLRVRRAGLKIGIYDGCFVDHSSLRSTFRGDPHKPADLRQNSAIFKQKYGAEHWAL